MSRSSSFLPLLIVYLLIFLGRAVGGKKKKSDNTPVTEMNTVYTNEMTGMVPANPDENDEDYAEDEEL